MPTDNKTLFTAHIKMGNVHLAKNKSHDNKWVDLLSFMGGLYRSIYIIFNFIVVLVARKLFMLNILN